MKTQNRIESDASLPSTVGQVPKVYIPNPTPQMKCASITSWLRVDVELLKIVNAWPKDFNGQVRLIYQRWARVIRKSVIADSAIPASEVETVEAVKLIERFPPPNWDNLWYLSNADGDRRVLELVGDLDDTMRLRLAGILWRLAQAAAAVARGQRRACMNPVNQHQISHRVAVVAIGPEHQATIDWFRRRHFDGLAVSDEGIAAMICECAFLVPTLISQTMDRHVRYRDSENLDGPLAMRAMILATQRDPNAPVPE